MQLPLAMMQILTHLEPGTEIYVELRSGCVWSGGIMKIDDDVLTMHCQDYRYYVRLNEIAAIRIRDAVNPEVINEPR